VLRDLPPRARRYIVAIIALGTVTFAATAPRAQMDPLPPLLLLLALSTLTSAFKIQLPIASGSTMSVTYVVDIASLILRGPHTTMLVGLMSAWTQSTVNAKGGKNPLYRTLFNISVLALTIEMAGHTFRALGGTPTGAPLAMIVPLLGMTATYFLANTILVALAVALTTSQPAWRIWRGDFASSAVSYLIGAITAAIVIGFAQRSGFWLALLLTGGPLYLTYRIYRSGIEVEARQGAILEAAHDAILTIDQDLTIREFNPAAERMFGRSRMDSLGRGIDLLLPSWEHEAQLSAFSRYLTSGTGPLARRRLELACVRADGTEFPVELTVARLGTDSRAILTGFIRDLTERRLLEAQLQQSQKLEAIGRLAGGVAHDFNNILMSIMGAADLILMELSQEAEARNEAAEIKRSVQRGANLTRQLLAMGRRQATGPQLLALGDIVGGMDTMLRRLIGPEIEFDIVLPAETVKVRANPSHIEQVVLNLVLNARDAMPKGGRVTVAVDHVRLDPDTVLIGLVEGNAGEYARLTVSDTGTGMSPQTKAKLFEPYFTTKEQGKGTGLGLSIVYGIVKQSGGYIRVISEMGRGATFVIYLPAAAAPAATPAPALA
jgi:PAS domain S-box-containing protein